MLCYLEFSVIREVSGILQLIIRTSQIVAEAPQADGIGDVLGLPRHVVLRLDPEILGEDRPRAYILRHFHSDSAGRCVIQRAGLPTDLRGRGVSVVSPGIPPLGDTAAVGENDLDGQSAAGVSAVQGARDRPRRGGGGEVVNVPEDAAIGGQGDIALVARVVLGLHGDGAVGKVHIGLAEYRADVEVDVLRLQELLCRAGDAVLPLVIGNLGWVGLDRPLVRVCLSIAAVVEDKAAVETGDLCLGVGDLYAIAEAGAILRVAVLELRHLRRVHVQLRRVAIGTVFELDAVHIQRVARKVGDLCGQRAGCALFSRETHTGDLDLTLRIIHSPFFADGHPVCDELGRIVVVVIEGVEIGGAYLDGGAVFILQVRGEHGVLPVYFIAAILLIHPDALQALVHVDDEIEAVAHAQVGVAGIGIVHVIAVRLAQCLLHVGVVGVQVELHGIHIGRAGVQGQVGVDDGLFILPHGVARQVGDGAAAGGKALAGLILGLKGFVLAHLHQLGLGEQVVHVDGSDLDIARQGVLALAVRHGIFKDQAIPVQLGQICLVLSPALTVGPQVEVQAALPGGAVVGEADGLVKGQLDLDGPPRTHRRAGVAGGPGLTVVQAVLDVADLGGTGVPEGDQDVLGVHAAGTLPIFKIEPLVGGGVEVQAAVVVALVVAQRFIPAADVAEVSDAGVFAGLILVAADGGGVAAADAHAEGLETGQVHRPGADLLPLVIAMGVGPVVEGGGRADLQILGGLGQLLQD